MRIWRKYPTVLITPRKPIDEKHMMIYFHQMSDSDHMPDMEQKRPTWTTFKTKDYFILDDHKMPDFQ